MTGPGPEYTIVNGVKVRTADIKWVDQTPGTKTVMFKNSVMVEIPDVKQSPSATLHSTTEYGHCETLGWNLTGVTIRGNSNQTDIITLKDPDQCTINTDDSSSDVISLIYNNIPPCKNTVQTDNNDYLHVNKQRYNSKSNFEGKLNGYY